LKQQSTGSNRSSTGASNSETKCKSNNNQQQQAVLGVAVPLATE